MTLKKNHGQLIVLSGPSGVGKSTVIAELLGQRPNIHFSVSYTTRQPRVGEQDGVNYNFVSRQEFERMIAANELLEYAEYVNHYYGTSLKVIEEKLKAGVDVLLDMMVQATKNGRVMACYVFFIHTIFFLITGSFYVTCTVLGPMVAPLFPKYGLSKVNLGRILLDTGVGFSPIVPWAMMGGFISNTLGVAVTDYFLFATLPYLNMIISLLYLITGFTVVPAGPDEAEQPQEQS